MRQSVSFLNIDRRVIVVPDQDSAFWEITHNGRSSGH